jgi:DNA-binding GntR family transcriptional regulator
MEVFSVTESALQFLRRKIITGELKPGQKLNECNLSEELGISRPPLRETFRILEKDYLVVTIPRKGTHVTKLSVSDFKEICQIREMIECFTIDLLEASSIRNLPKVTAAINRSLALSLPVNSADPEELLNGIKLLVDFHDSLIESSGNLRMAYMYHSVGYNLARYQFIYFQIEGTVQHSLDDHKKILRLIANSDYNQAKEELRKHIRYAGELVERKVFTKPCFVPGSV